MAETLQAGSGAPRAGSPGAAGETPEAAANLLLARLFFDLLRAPSFEAAAAANAQRRLDRLSLPSFMEPLQVCARRGHRSGPCPMFPCPPPPPPPPPPPRLLACSGSRKADWHTATERTSQILSPGVLRVLCEDLWSELGVLRSIESDAFCAQLLLPCCCMMSTS